MSAYMTLLTPMTDQECLLAALADLGFDGTKVEVHATPVSLVGYAGDRRAQVRRSVANGSQPPEPPQKPGP